MAGDTESRRAVHIAMRVGVVMLSRGAQVDEVDAAVRTVCAGFGLDHADAVVTFGTVTVSEVTPGDARATTAIGTVRAWAPDFTKLTAAAALVDEIRDGRTDVANAEVELDRIATLDSPFPSWLVFAAPALLSFFVTFLFGGSLGDAATTLAIGLAIQPALATIERSELPQFFQVVVGVGSTTLIVVLLVRTGLAIEGSLVLTGSLLRFLPGGALVSGMHDLIAGSVLPGVANLAQVALLGAAVAGSASLVLGLGKGLDVELTIDASGAVQWPAIVVALAGAAAVLMSAVRVATPVRRLPSLAALGAVAVVIAQGFTPVFEPVGSNARTLIASIIIGMVATLLAHHHRTLSVIWTVPAILPLLPAPATLLPLLADTDEAQQSLQGRAFEIAFAIGVGVASGSILVTTALRYRGRMLDPVVSTLARVTRPSRRPEADPES
jgi:uncharacterized membrane protein YjjP (DUF1212 family)/uncharacterized membrane protein YjjB (DUF3815 family)